VKRAGFLLILLLPACHREAPPQPTAPRRVITKTIPSDAKNANVNAVVRVDPPVFMDAADVSVQGDTVNFTMKLRESPKGLVTRATWKDAKGKELSSETHPMNGAMSVTFTKKGLKPGRYKVEGWWGGNLAAEKAFEIAR
jgi:hypothetical protein